MNNLFAVDFILVAELTQKTMDYVRAWKDVLENELKINMGKVR